MPKFEQILDGAIERCKGHIIEDNAYNVGFQKIYPFTTENINGYINGFDLEDKSLLTVGSSADQVLNASLYGSKNITLLDVNPYTRFYYYLKVAALIELDYNNFLSFLCSKIYTPSYRVNLDLYSKSTFDKIKNTLKLLDTESFVFWNTLFETYDSKTMNDALFSNDVHDEAILKKINPYLASNILFDELKDRIKNIFIKFYSENILDALLNESYDNIWLSNIGKWMNKEDMVRMVKIMSKYLNVDGTLLACYSYKVSKEEADDELKLLRNNFNPDNFDSYTYSFDTTYINSYSAKNKDGILIYKRKY